MSKRVLIIDGQLFQTPAWARGMGRYSSCLLQAVHQKFTYDKVIFLLNKNLALSEGAAEVVQRMLPNAAIEYISFKLPKSRAIPQVHRNNKALLNDYIHHNFAQDDVDFLQIGLFQSEYYPVFPDGVRKLLIFYDLIPYQYPKIYNPDISYLYRFNSLFEADHFFAISETVKSDLHTILAIPLEKITNLDGGSTLDYRTVHKKKLDFTLPKKYILAPSGNDYRKNNVRATQAFERFRTLSGEDYKMVFTSHFDATQKQELEAISENLIFTGVVDDATLQALFEQAEMLLFASEYEGLGLPILESVVFGKKIICSDISAFREISSDAFYFFDPADVESIHQALRYAEYDKDWPQKLSAYKAISERYTWESAAERFQEILAKPATSEKTAPLKKKRIAIVAPHLENTLGMASVVNALHTMLDAYEVDYYLESAPIEEDEFRRASYLSFTTRTFDVREFDARRYHQYDAVLYHLTNSDRNALILTRALTLPGIVFAHDDSLAVAYSNLVDRQIISPERLQLEQHIETAMHLTKDCMLGSVIEASHAVVSVLGGVLPNRIAQKDHSLPRQAKKYHNSINPLIDFAYSPRAASHRGRHVAIFWDHNWTPETCHRAHDCIQRLAQSDEFDSVRISIISLGLINDQVMALANENLNVTVAGAVSEFELDTILETVDVLIDPAGHAGTDSLAVSSIALQKGGTVFTCNRFAQFSGADGVHVFRNNEALREALTNSARVSLTGREKMAQDTPVFLRKLIESVNRSA